MAYSDRIYKGNSLIKNLNNYTVLDIETTSLDSYYGEILEISGIKIRDKKTIDTFSEIIKIKDEVGPYTTMLTGITNEDVEKQGKEIITVLKDFKDFLSTDIIVGHNVNFDINFIYDSMKENLGEYLINDYVDTLRLSRRLLPNLKHHKLDDLIQYFNLNKRYEHRALNDCILTNQVYIKLCNILETKI